MFLWTETFPLKDWGDWLLIGCFSKWNKGRQESEEDKDKQQIESIPRQLKLPRSNIKQLQLLFFWDDGFSDYKKTLHLNVCRCMRVYVCRCVCACTLRDKTHSPTSLPLHLAVAEATAKQIHFKAGLTGLCIGKEAGRQADKTVMNYCHTKSE